MKKFLLTFALLVTFTFYALENASKEASSAPLAITTTDTTISSATISTTIDTPSTSPPPTPNPAPDLKPAATPTPVVIKGKYIDGSYPGNAADAVYGYIQVKAVVTGGKLTDVIFLQHPNDRRTSIEINTEAMPYLKQEALAAQSAKVDIISGATDSSQAFIESLGSALAKALHSHA